MCGRVMILQGPATTRFITHSRELCVFCSVRYLHLRKESNCIIIYPWMNIFFFYFIGRKYAEMKINEIKSHDSLYNIGFKPISSWQEFLHSRFACKNVSLYGTSTRFCLKCYSSVTWYLMITKSDVLADNDI